MSNAGSSTKSWWSKVAGNKELRQNYIDTRPDRRTSVAARPSSGLKSIAVAIGLKSKKPSREPLSPAVGSHALDTTIDIAPNSPSSSLGPYPPFDSRLQRPRQSLLTLADDPFAHPPIVFVRQSPVPSHSSVYSSPSVTDFVPSKPGSLIFRSSYASSSTNSNSLGPENCVANSHRALPESKKLRLKRSIGSMQVKLPNDPSLQSSYFSTTNLSPEGRRPASDESPGRPRMRSRGMTVGGLPQKSGFFVKEQKTDQKLSHTLNIAHTSPKPPERPGKQPFILRQIPSSSRLVAPPTAPPIVGLPAPPSTLEQPDFPRRKGVNSLSSLAPSSPSLSLVNNHMEPVLDDARTSQQAPPVEDHSYLEPSLKSGPRTLKKPPSQQSLRRAASGSSSISSKTATSPDASEKKKQRNSQQSRLPMPTLSLSIRTSFVSTPSHPRNGDPTSPSSISEQRRPRKRLFSNSQRPSTSTCVSREDDSSSVLSLRSEHDSMRTPYKSWAVTRNYSKPSPSFWDEGADTTPSSPAVDYQPQAIMSRDELAKLDASVSNRETESPMDSRFPFPSVSRPEVVHHEPSRVALSPPPSTKPGRRSARSSDMTLASSTSRSGRPRRPFTADPLVRVGSKETEIGATESRRRVASSAATHLDTIPDATSLPPPPRPRIISGSSVWSTSTTSTLIQSPVEQPSSSKGKTLERPSTTISSPLQLDASGNGGSLIATRPVPRSHTTSRGKSRTSGLEMAIHRRSIMRKPSFLEIDGESDQDSEPEMVEKRDSLLLNMKPPSIDISSKTGESFLDFARESFDTVLG